MADDDTPDPSPQETHPGRPVEEVMSRLADGEGDRRALLGDLFDWLAPVLRDYFAERGIAPARTDELVRVALREVDAARASYIDRASVLVWAFAFACRLAQRETSAAPNVGTEAMRLAVRGLHTKDIARVLDASERDIRRALADRRALLGQSLAPSVVRPNADYDPMAIEVPGYRMLRLLDEGGMGYVFEAEHLALGVRHAIKVMKDRPGDDDEAEKRFLDEARMMIGITNENIVRVYFADRLDDGRAWYAMDLLEGHTLKERLAKVGRLAWSQVAKIVRQICAGLQHVHDRGIVHCDIKPANCFVVRDDLEQPQVKLLDFGVARLLRADEGVLGNDNPGTPRYMAPELFRGKRPDARSDVYAIGVMMFELLTGQLPFEGTSVAAQIVEKQIDEAPRLSARSGLTFPRGVERVVQRALAADPSRRFQSVPELDAAIAALGVSGRGRLPFSGRRGEQLRTIAVTASCSALAAAFVTAVVLGEHRTRVPLDFTAAVASVEDRLDECRAEHPAPPSTTSVKFKVVAGSGAVTKVDVDGVDEELSACMRGVLDDIVFEPSDTAGGHVELEGEL